MKTLATIFLVVWAAGSIVAYYEGLKPRGSHGFRALNFLIEASAVGLAAWTLL